MPRKTVEDHQATLDALNSGHVDPAPEPVWVVLQFGRGRRPSIACSTQLDLAIASFMQTAYITAALFPEETFSIVGDDDDAALQGLCLYIGDVLTAALQPAAGIVRHPRFPSLPGLPAPTFAASAPLLLAALSKRTKVGKRETEKLLHSQVAYSWLRDPNQRGPSVTEAEARKRVSPAQIDAIWDAMASARVMETMTATIG